MTSAGTCPVTRAHPGRPAWHPQPRPARRPRRPALAAAAALTAAAQPALAEPALLAAASIGQVISNTTLWIVGILAGLATLFLTLGGVRYLMAGGDPARSRGPRPRCGPPRSATGWRSWPRSSSPS